MSTMDWRVRLLGKLMPDNMIVGKSPSQIARLQKPRPHSFLMDLVAGSMKPGVTVEDGVARGGDGHIPVRSYRPTALSGTLPLIVLIHGGGWTVGTLNQYDSMASSIALAADAVVVSLDYRLAPSHPWPAAAEDCYAAFVDVVSRARQWGADGSRVALVGDSAGGNLSAVTAMLVRDRGGPAIALQALLYPATDLTLSSPSVIENATMPVLKRPTLEAYVALYVPDPADRADPTASPLLAEDHAGLPPALVQVAELDPVRDDGLRYAEALQAAGVPVRFTEYVGMPHGYLAFPRFARSATQAFSELVRELRTHLAPG
ncbi:alpha/beta hydrolase [Rhodococcus sp. BP-332]|nr:alpha/beta hydrolase [Rhodococcus sp. BP-332]